MEGGEASAPVDAGGAVDTGTAVDAAPAVEAAPEITADTFGWDSWTGLEDDLPETIRPWAPKLQSHYMRDAELARKEAEKARQIYETFLEGQEDPRIAEFKKELETGKTTYAELEQRYRQLDQQHAEYRQQVEAWGQQQADQAFERYKAANEWMFDDGPVQALGSELLSDGFEPDDLPVLLRMPQGKLDFVRKAAKELASKGMKSPGPLAIRLGHAEYKAPEPNPTAQLVGETRSTPTTRPVHPGKDASLEDHRTAAIERIFNKRG